MRKQLVVGLIATFFLGYPLLNEGVLGSCSALEKRWYTFSISRAETSLVGSVVMRSLVETGDGFFASEYVRKIEPNVPPFLICYYFYWRSFFDGTVLSDIKLSLGSVYQQNAKLLISRVELTYDWQGIVR